MNDAGRYSEVVEAEGHLIDSQLLNVIFDTVVKRDASFDVLKFNIGRSNDEPSRISMRDHRRRPSRRCSGARGARGARLPPRAMQTTRCVRAADRDGCVPDDFYSTTNHRTLVRHGGQWIEVEQPAHGRRDRGRRRRARSCRKLRDVRDGRRDRLRRERHPRRSRSSTSATATASRS